MAIAVALVGRGIQTQLFTDQVNVFLLSRQKEPAWPSVILFRISLEHRWRILRGVNTNGVKEDVFAYAVSQHLLHLGQTCCLQRAGVDAVCINQVDNNDFPLDQVVIEMNSSSILCSQLYVRKIIRSPVRVIVGRNCGWAAKYWGSKYWITK